MEINKIFSERFSELVFESGITPKELAAVLAIDLTDIYAYLKGKIIIGARLQAEHAEKRQFICQADHRRLVSRQKTSDNRKFNRFSRIFQMFSRLHFTKKRLISKIDKKGLNKSSVLFCLLTFTARRDIMISMN